MGRRIPAVAILILLNDVGHVNGLGHVPIMHGLSGLGNRDYVSSSRDVLAWIHRRIRRSFCENNMKGAL
jgi:hypothetical protein